MSREADNNVGDHSKYWVNDDIEVLGDFRLSATPLRPYRQEIIVPEVSRAGTYRTEPAIDHDFATPEEIEA